MTGMERENSRTRPAQRMVLAFDASCATCRAVSERVQSATAGKLETRGLGDPEVAAWRQESMDNPPWEPTLLRVGAGGRVRAWTGLGMVRPLIRHLGLKHAVRVMRELGALRQEWSDLGADRARPRTLTRRSIVQVGMGAVVGAGILTGGASTALAAPGATPRFRNTRVVVGEELAASLPEVFDHADVRNLVPLEQLEGLRNAAVTPSQEAAGTQLQISPEGETRLTANDVRPGTVSLVHQSRHQTQAGGDVRVTALSLPEDRILVLEEYAPSFQGLQSKAFVAQMDYAAGTATFLAHSANGTQDRPVEAGVRADCDNGKPENDPCGGCCLNGSGAVLVERCKTSDVWKCAFASASCAACAGSCGEFGPACGLCLMGACGNAVIACCDGTANACSSDACLP